MNKPEQSHGCKPSNISWWLSTERSRLSWLSCPQGSSARLLFSAPELSQDQRDIDLLYIRPFLTSFEAQSSVTAFGLNRWSVGKKSGPIMPVPIPICPSLFYLCISVWLLTLKVCFQPCWTYVFLLCISGFFLWAHSVLLLDKASERCFRGNWVQYKKEGMQSGICFYVCMNYL